MEDLAYWEKNALDRPQFDNPVTREYIKGVVKVMHQNIHGIKKLTILDCGCGNGRYMYFFNRFFAKSAGFDYSPQMIQEAKDIGIKNVKVGNGLAAPYPENTFDVTFGACYIHNLSSELKAVKEMVRVSKKYIVILEPNPISLLGLYHLVTPTEELHSLKFTESYIVKLLKKCKTKIIYSGKYGYITPNKTPKSMVSFMKSLPFQSVFGFYTITIAEKRTSKKKSSTKGKKSKKSKK